MTWKEKYMKNMVTLVTLQKLVRAGILLQSDIDLWVDERAY